MATLAGNSASLTLGGTNVAAYAVVGNLSASAEEVDITAGFGATFMERAPGLKDTAFKCTIVYDAADHATYIDKMEPGQTMAVVFGPEGTGSGNPKHDQSMLLTSVAGPVVDVKKTMSVFELSFVGAAVPTTNMYAGGVF